MKKFPLCFAVLTIFLTCPAIETPYCKQLLSAKYDQVLTSLLKATSQELNAPGAVLYIRFPDGSIWKKSYGMARLGGQKDEQMSLDMQFRIASVTKTFIGTAVLQLVDEGVLHLESTVEEVLPGVLKDGNDVTVRMLLNHSSAIADYATTDDFTEKWVQDFTYKWSARELFDYIKSDERLDKPGLEGYYSNTNYYLLGMIIEKFSALSLPEYLDERIFIPLGMDNTYFPTASELSGRQAYGYFDFNENGRFETDEIIIAQDPSAIWAAGMVVSNVKDLSIWINELVDGTLIGDDLQQERLKFDMQLHGAPDFVKTGLGVAIIDGAVGHTGAIPGFTSVLFRYKNTDIIALSNCFHTQEGKGSVAETLLKKIRTEVIDTM